MNYGNWKHILGVFKVWKQSYDGIFVNTHIMRDSPVATFDFTLLFFFSFFFFHFSFFFFNLLFLSFFFFLFAFLIPVRFFFLPFRLSYLNSFFFPPFSSHSDQVLRYGSHKKLKYLSDVKWKQCAKWVEFRKFGYFKW